MAQPIDIPELDTLNLVQAKEEILRLHKLVESQAAELNEIEMKAIAKQNSDFRIGGLKQFIIEIENESLVKARTQEHMPKYCFWLEQSEETLLDALTCTEYHLKMFAAILGRVSSKSKIKELKEKKSAELLQRAALERVTNAKAPKPVGRTPKTPLEKFLAQYTKIGLSEEQALEIAKASKIFPDLK